MLAVYIALLPILALIALGYVLRRAGFPGSAFWPPAERVTYFVLFPALLVHGLAGASPGALEVLPMVGALFVSVLLMTLALGRLRERLTADGPAFSSVVQGSIRMNTYVGLALATGLYGAAGLTLAAVAIAVLVPTVNVVSVATLGRYAGANPMAATMLPGLLARNPLILACLAGILLNVTGVGLPGPVGAAVELTGRAALPLGLLCVGAGLDLAAAREARPLVIAACLFKLIALPLLAAFACALFRVEGLTAAIAILFAALPSAPTSYVLARQLGGDAPLMAAIISAQLLAAVVTLPAMISLLG
jgi:predicted permease